MSFNRKGLPMVISADGEASRTEPGMDNQALTRAESPAEGYTLPTYKRKSMRRLVVVPLGITAIWASSSNLSGQEKAGDAIVDVGLRKQLLVDDHIISTRVDLTRALGQPDKANGGKPRVAPIAAVCYRGCSATFNRSLRADCSKGLTNKWGSFGLPFQGGFHSDPTFRGRRSRLLWLQPFRL